MLIEDLCYLEKELCTLFYTRFHLSVLLWKKSALTIYMYLIGDHMDSRFRAFITNLEKNTTARNYSTSFYQHTLCDFEHISELYSTHFIKGRYFASVL